MDEDEYCALCDDPTGRSGEDSLYSDDGNGGPYCEECYDQYLVLDRLPRLESRITELESQLAAADRRAEEKDAEAYEVRKIFIESYDIGIMIFPTEATAGGYSREWRSRWTAVFMQAQMEAQARAEREEAV